MSPEVQNAREVPLGLPIEQRNLGFDESTDYKDGVVSWAP